MGYVAIKGGENAIQSARSLLEYLRTREGRHGEPLSCATIEYQLRALHSKVISEGGLYHPTLTALAIKQSMGDPLEAAFALRAYRSTKPRIANPVNVDTSDMRLIRRISASFKDIPGGQMLGPSTDYHLRFLRFDLLNESPEQFRAIAQDWLDKCASKTQRDTIPDSFPKVIEALRDEGLIDQVNVSEEPAFDITREPLVFPLPRSANLATMARAESGGLLTLAYSSMRGYGDIHPTVAELRVGYVPVMSRHPVTGNAIEIGEILVTECEIIAMYEKEPDSKKPVFKLGYGACFGHNETKAISMAILDRALQKGASQGARHPSEDQEFVLLHIDGIDSMGFCSHYKMPHYVTFQSDMDRLRHTQEKHRHDDENVT
jgi:alpha-D-ribose 1-methylphosphonate 5-triphosphate synthase subunit PhnI